MFLLFVGNMLSVVLRLMNCQAVGPHFSVHFYFGDEECYGERWVMSLVCLLLLMAIFVLVFVRLRRLDVAQRQSKSHALNTFVARYKPR